MTTERIKELSEQIHSARIAYYNLDPVISDQVYDALVDELKRLDPNNTELTAVGAPVPQNTPWAKVKHLIPMGSLNKVNSHNEFKEWASGTGSETFLISHKIDGSSLEVIYKNGQLVSAVSRGDGVVGDELFQNAIQIPNLPKSIRGNLPESININSDIIVRGEVVMMKDVFQKEYSSEYANPRNTAAGKIRDKKNKGVDCVNLSFLAYTIVCDEALRPPRTEFYRMKLLKSMGFETPPCEEGGIDVMSTWFESAKTNRESIPYEIDGIVVRVNDVETQEILGELNMRPKGQIAWKFDPSMGTSRIVSIKWQIGQSGRCTPVAVIEPVEVGGVTITNVSLHNLSMFKELDLHKGDRVLISRRNDVIPFLESNLG
jgi:DNA ligase (NAD+)